MCACPCMTTRKRIDDNMDDMMDLHIGYVHLLESKRSTSSGSICYWNQWHYLLEYVLLKTETRNGLITHFFLEYAKDLRIIVIKKKKSLTIHTTRL